MKETKFTRGEWSIYGGFYETLEFLLENVDMSDQQYDRVTLLLAEARGEQ